MLKRLRFLLISVIIILFSIQILFITTNSELISHTQDNVENPNFNGNLEGTKNIIITKINRIANISGYGLIHFEDTISVKNLNSNPITSIFIAIPLNLSDDLVFYEATGNDKNTLLTERSYMIMSEYDLITIYFDTPLLPQQSKTIIFIHQYRNQITYYEVTYEETHQYFKFKGFVYPILPYKAEGDINAKYHIPKIAGDIQGSWGRVEHELYYIEYSFKDIKDQVKSDYLLPFLENLNESRIINITFYHDQFSRLEISKINREIFISPWGIIKIKEDITIENLGIISYNTLKLNIPRRAKEVYVSDEFGEILGVTISSIANSTYKKLNIDILQNRVQMIPNSSFSFSVRYFLPFEEYCSLNWFQESIKIDLLTSNFEYLGRQQIIKVIIDGCISIDSISESPESIEKSHGTIVLIYSSNYVSPLETKFIQFTFTLDLFDLLLRPIIILFLISIISSSYVLLVKLRKKGAESPLLKKEYIPVNEIREFCSLHEEKNALILEIRQAEEDAKRKKIAKKNYKNILNKNTSKIDEIQKEIIPFKKTLMETSETFENIVKKLDILEAEQISIKDSLNLLESRYKRGRLPSRAAYLKLSDDFNKRRRKVDRTIDKFIQQLRSYLL